MRIEFDLNTALQGKFDWVEICHSLEKELNQVKGKSQSSEANQIWRNLQLFSIWRDYEQVYISLKEKGYYDAWCLIEQVLITNKFLLENFPEEGHNTEFIRKHLLQLQMLFPYRVFLSTVMQIKEEVCSICGFKISPWTKCEHTPGKIYNGELCLKEVRKFDFLGADIVLSPEHKYAVMFACNDAGERIDNYDYRLVEELMKIWANPFQDWEINREEIYLQPQKEIIDTNPCPCMRSFDNYADCCKKRPGILSYRYIIKNRESLSS